MRVAVTGSSGYIGRHLVADLARQDMHVFEIGRSRSSKNSEWCKLDLLDFRDEAVAGLHAELLIHLAGETGPAAARLNVDLARAATRIAELTGARRLLNFSSAGVLSRRGQRINDLTPVHPTGAYEVSKRDAERLLDLWKRSAGIAVIHLRPTWVFGGDRSRCFETLRRVASWKYLPLPSQPGNVNCVYVNDLVSVTVWLARREWSRDSYLVAESIPVEELLGEIIDQQRLAPIRVSVPMHPVRWALDATRFAERAGILSGTWITRLDALVDPRRYIASWLLDDLKGWPPLGWREGLRRCLASSRDTGPN